MSDEQMVALKKFPCIMDIRKLAQDQNSTNFDDLWSVIWDDGFWDTDAGIDLLALWSDDLMKKFVEAAVERRLVSLKMDIDHGWITRLHGTHFVSYDVEQDIRWIDQCVEHASIVVDHLDLYQRDNSKRYGSMQTKCRADMRDESLDRTRRAWMARYMIYYSAKASENIWMKEMEHEFQKKLRLKMQVEFFLSAHIRKYLNRSLGF